MNPIFHCTQKKKNYTNNLFARNPYLIPSVPSTHPGLRYLQIQTNLARNLLPTLPLFIFAPPQHSKVRFPSPISTPPCPTKSPLLQLIVVDAVMVAIRNSRLHRLGRLADFALDLLARALLGGGGSLLAQILVALRGRLAVILAHVDVGGVLAVVLDELSEVLDGAGTGVDDGFGFAAGGEQLDGGEALDLVGDVVGRGVDFGDGDLGCESRVGAVQESELFVFWGEAGGSLSVDLVMVDIEAEKLTLCSVHTMGRRILGEHPFRC